MQDDLRTTTLAKALKRRGARHPTLVPAETLDLLIEGAETANFMEQIALDFERLMSNFFPDFARGAEGARLRRGPLIARMRLAAEIMLRNMGVAWLDVARSHASDTIRGWGAMSVGLVPNISLERRINLAAIFADDSHFGVREWCWIGVRSHIVSDPIAAIVELCKYAHSDSFRVRRFSSESCRPRGVWSAHIPLLKVEPEHGLPILNALKRDTSRYVQDSVANWINDASKTDAAWAERLLSDWSRDIPNVDHRLIRRAGRSLLV